MNWLTLAVEAVAIWSLYRIHYWKAYPLFYAKLVAATVLYATEQPYSPAWWREWWEPGAAVMSLLMVAAAWEAFKRMTVLLPAKEAGNLLAACSVVFGAITGVLMLAWQSVGAMFTAVELGIAAAMVVAWGYESYAYMPGGRTGKLHFALLTVLNISCGLVDLLYRYAVPDEPMQWELLHAVFTCSYCILLILWAWAVPMTIRTDDVVSVRGAN